MNSCEVQTTFDATSTITCIALAQWYPYNNFEVLSVARFSVPDMRKFNAAVDATNNIYRHRCGGSAI